MHTIEPQSSQVYFNAGLSAQIHSSSLHTDALLIEILRQWCFNDGWIADKCCKPDSDIAACWDTSLDTSVLKSSCCLNEPLKYDSPPSQWLRSDVEASLSCRSSDKWSRFRRFLLSRAVVDDTALVTNRPDLQRVYGLIISSMLMGYDRSEDRMTSNLLMSAFGGLDDCFLGYAFAFLMYVAVASHHCAVVYRGEGTMKCLGEEERSHYLSVASQLHLDAAAGLQLPEELTLGLLASAPWPFRRLHLDHFSQNYGALSGHPWAHGLNVSHYVKTGGFDITSLTGTEQRFSFPLRILVVSRDWGGAELATSLAHSYEMLEVTMLVDVSMQALVDRLPVAIQRVWEDFGSDAALSLAASRSDILVATSTQMGLSFAERFGVPVIIYYWSLDEFRGPVLEREWERVRSCDILARADFGTSNSDVVCVAVAASTTIVEIALPRAGFALPLTRPLCLYGVPPSRIGPVPQIALTLSKIPELYTYLILMATPDFPIAFETISIAKAWMPPQAVGAVLFPWALWLVALPELFAAEMPTFVPSAEYLAEFACAQDVASLILNGSRVRSSRLPPVRGINLQNHQSIWRTRCGSSLPAMAALGNISQTSQARIVVEFSELTYWPGLLRFSSLADLFQQLVDFAENDVARDAVVNDMRLFNSNAKATGRAWWSEVLHRLHHNPGSIPPDQMKSFNAFQASPAPSIASVCGFPEALPPAADTPMKVLHKKTLSLFVGFEAKLRRMGLQYSLGFGTLLGAVRHRGLVQYENDLDVHLGFRTNRHHRGRFNSGNIAQRRSLLWLCHFLRVLVRRNPSSRHRFVVLCSGTIEARKARAVHVDALANGWIPLCPGSLHSVRDPWYDADRVGIYEADPVAARIMVRSTSNGAACIGQFLDVYASREVFELYGPLCRCTWEGLHPLCFSRWDAYLRHEYGPDYMKPVLGLPHDIVPCPLFARAENLSYNDHRARRHVGQRYFAQGATDVGRDSCWDSFQMFTPVTCCYHKFGPQGNPDCWDAIHTAARCCNESTWPEQDVIEYQKVLLVGWDNACANQNASLVGQASPRWWEGKGQELLFSWYYLKAGESSEVRRHAEEFSAALNSEAPLDRQLRELLTRDSEGRILDAPRHVRVLDIGSGPLSVIGRFWLGVHIDIVAVDPLACEYQQMRQDLGISTSDTRIASPEACDAEHLSNMFTQESFDIAHCTNALDHSYDPIIAISEAVRVVRRGRAVLLRHRRNEGELQNYAGLHQWNFDLRNGRLVVWSPTSVTNPRGTEVDVEMQLIREGLVNIGGVHARVVDAPYMQTQGQSVGPNDWIEAVIWRRLS